MNGIITNVVNGKAKDVDIKIWDNSKMFDSMFFKETLNDLYDAGVEDDKVALWYESNKKCDIAIRTPYGLTPRKQINEVIMQGWVFGGLEASLQIDLLGKYCMQNGNNYFENNEKHGKPIYLYKESLHLPPLSFVDDVAGFSECGSTDSLILSIKTVIVIVIQCILENINAIK